LPDKWAQDWRSIALWAIFNELGWADDLSRRFILRPVLMMGCLSGSADFVFGINFNAIMRLAGRRAKLRPLGSFIILQHSYDFM